MAMAMAIHSSPTGRAWRRSGLETRRMRIRIPRTVAALAVLLVASRASGDTPAPPRPTPAAVASSPSRFPTVPADHTHVRALLENAMRFVAPENRMIDPASGYVVEGWNHDPKRGLFFRSFTQLTAIGQWMELLAGLVAGDAETPGLPRDQALMRLSHAIRSLRHDQHDPHLASEGLLGNFLDLATGNRLGPLAPDVDHSMFLEAFGREKGEAIWEALKAKGWIVAHHQDREATIQRGTDYGSEHFDGPLAPHGDAPTKRKVMEILDRRVVMLVFGDNANLSASVARTIGALLHPRIRDEAGVDDLRRELERFLDDQRAGYAHLHDEKAGLFDFGFDASKGRLFGWEDLQGIWKTGHMDYLVNEFRAPATFVVLRYAFPPDAIANLGFKIKPYTMHDGREVYALVPWEGSAFQAMGLGLWLDELNSPSWRTLMNNMVEIEVDFATRRKLPGFLSESYTGEGVQYTGSVGIPEITVSPKPRITDAASLYTLGVAYTIAPDRIERFLAANWPVVSTLLTDHGPWEGYNVTRREPIEFQTSAHTLALILGFLGTGSEHMDRYLASRGLGERLATFYTPGGRADLSSDETRVFAWTDKEGPPLVSTREGGTFRVRGDRLNRIGIAYVANRPGGVNLSGGRLGLRYRSSGAMDAVLVALKPATDSPAAGEWIPKEITTHFVATNGREAEIQIPLPATPGLTRIKEIVITHEDPLRKHPVDLSITRLGFTPEVPAARIP